MIEQHHFIEYGQALPTRKPCPICCERPARIGGRYCSNACKQKAYRERLALRNTRNETGLEQSHAVLGDILAELKALRRENAELRDELSQLKQMPLTLQTSSPTLPNIQRHQARIDDIENDERLNLTIQGAKTEQNTSLNLQITTTLAISGDSFLYLPLESLEYGLKQGDLGVTPAMLEQKRAMLAEKNAQKGKNKPIMGDRAGKPPKPLQGQAKPIAKAEQVELTTPADLDELDLSDW